MNLSRNSAPWTRIARCWAGWIAAFLLAIPAIAQQPGFLTNGLVAYYPFNGNTKDESGNGRDGVFVSSSLGGAFQGGGSDRHGKLERALTLDGSSCLKLSNSETLNLSSSFTISLWIKKNRRLFRLHDVNIQTSGLD